MNDYRPFAMLSLLFALLLSACSGASERGDPPLKGARVGGPFTLVNQDGQTVRDSDFKGKYRSVYFGYTYCPDVCPVDMQVLGQGLKMFEKTDAARAAKVQPIFISVDPERDTPAVIKEFVANFHPRFIGLTGTPEQLAATAKEFGVYFARSGDPAAKDYLVDHTNIALLMGPDGEPIAMLPHDKGPGAVAAELQRWVE